LALLVRLAGLSRAGGETMAKVRAVLMCGVSMLVAGACRSGADPIPGETTGVVMLDLTGAPSNARCAQIQIDPGAILRRFDLTPESPAAFVLKGLPTGAVTLTESVFSVACKSVTGTSVPILTSAGLMVTLVAGVPMDVTFNLAPPDAGGVV